MRTALLRITFAGTLIGLVVLLLTGWKALLGVFLGLWIATLIATSETSAAALPESDDATFDGVDAQGLNVKPVNFHPLADD